jgi:hypothetical protein
MVLVPNCLMLAEIGCPFGEMCCLHHQGRREIWQAKPRRLSYANLWNFLPDFTASVPKTQIFSHCRYNF